MQGAFYGIGAAVIAIIARSVYKLTKLSLAKDRLLWAVFVVSAVVTAWTESELILLFFAAGALIVAVRARSTASTRRPRGHPAVSTDGSRRSRRAFHALKIFWYFTEAGRLCVRERTRDRSVPAWRRGHRASLAERAAVPRRGCRRDDHAGTGRHHGRLHRLSRGRPARWRRGRHRRFLPCFLFVILPAPYYQRYGNNPHLRAFVEGVTAAAAGAIAGAAFVLGKRAIYHLPTILIAAATMAALLKIKKAPEPLIIAVAGVCGLVLRSFW